MDLQKLINNYAKQIKINFVSCFLTGGTIAAERCLHVKVASFMAAVKQKDLIPDVKPEIEDDYPMFEDFISLATEELIWSLLEVGKSGLDHMIRRFIFQSIAYIR